MQGRLVNQKVVNSQRLALIHKYDPDLVCVSSDVSCLLSYIEINIKKLSNKNLTKFETEVQQLTKLFTTIIVSTGYLRNTLVKITNMFRKYWMPKGEDRYKGEHLAIVNKFIRAPKDRVNDFLIKKQQQFVLFFCGYIIFIFMLMILLVHIC